MVRCRDQQRRSAVPLDELKYGANNPSQLAMISRIGALLSKGIELIEEQYDWHTLAVLEHTTQI